MRSGPPVSREALLERAKGSLDVHLCRLRAKLGLPLVKTVRGVEYVLRTSPPGGRRRQLRSTGWPACARISSVD